MWGLVTTAIGMTIIVLIVVGTEYGVWLDEIGPSIDIADQAAAPTIVLPGMLGLLAVGLVVRGLAVGLTISREHRGDSAPASLRAE